jgi:hypothetical protein
MVEIGVDMGIKEDLLVVAQKERDRKINAISAEQNAANTRYNQQIQDMGEMGDRAALESLLLNRSQEAWEEYNLSAGQRQLLRDLLKDNRESTLVEILEAFEELDTQIKSQLTIVRSTEHGKGIIVTRSSENASWASRQWHATEEPPEDRDEIYTYDDLTATRKLIRNTTSLDLTGTSEEPAGVLLASPEQVIAYIESIKNEGERYQAILAVQSSMIGQYIQPHFQVAIDFYKDHLEDAVASCLKTDERIVEKLGDVRYHIMRIIDDERGDHERLTRAVKHTLEKAAEDLMRSLLPIYSSISSERLEEMITQELTHGAIDIINTARENLNAVEDALDPIRT